MMASRSCEPTDDSPTLRAAGWLAGLHFPLAPHPTTRAAPRAGRWRFPRSPVAKTRPRDPSDPALELVASPAADGRAVTGARSTARAAAAARRARALELSRSRSIARAITHGPPMHEVPRMPMTKSSLRRPRYTMCTRRGGPDKDYKSAFVIFVAQVSREQSGAKPCAKTCV